MPFLIRPAKSDDFDKITAIYAEAVAHGTASFELTVPDRMDMLKRWQTLADQGYPYLVLEADGSVQGYAYAGAYRARPAYRFVVENSVYLDEGARGKGYGKALLTELIVLLERDGFRQIVAIIGDSANTASIKLHEACGFHHVGVLRDMGWKHETWLDTVYMQLPLGDGGTLPPDPHSRPFQMAAIRKTT